MKYLLGAMGQLPEYRTLLSAVQASRMPAAATGLSHIHKAHLTAALMTDAGRRVVFVASDESEATRLAEDFGAMGFQSLTYPARDFTFRNMEGRSREYEHARLGILSRMLEGRYDIVLTTIDAASQFTLPPHTLYSRIATFKVGQRLSLEQAMRMLISGGYVRAEQVEGPGQFSHRGGILDFFTPELSAPIRMEFWGDEIDSIASFDIVSQRRGETLKEVPLSPAAEVLYDPQELAVKLENFTKGVAAPQSRTTLEEDIRRLREGLSLSAPDRYLPLCYDSCASLFDYAEDALIIVSETAKIKERVRTSGWQMGEDIVQLLQEGILAPGLDKFALGAEEFMLEFQKRDSLFLDTFARGSYDIPIRETAHFTLRQLSPFSGGVDLLCEDLEPAIASGYSCVVLAGTDRAAGTLAADLRDRKLPALYAPNPQKLLKNQILVTSGGLSAGFDYPASRVMLITFGKAAPRGSLQKRKRAPGEIIHSLDELKIGDYVVHSAHGIGIFDGIHKIETQNVIKDYIKIKYAKEDVLYVPVTQLDLVSKYIGPREDAGVRIHRLGGTEWQKTKARVKSAVRDMAKQLTVLYAKRMSIPGYAFPPDSEFQFDFERRFEYEETEDQLRCVEEIKRDMERGVPMDRLLCGDVGFGKTEVALRAAFKCIAGGRQCAILVPTTILAWQHYQTVSRRMSAFPVNVELLSRFRSPKQQEEILRKLVRGDVDLVVGTHRLISKDVRFRDLGLVVVDEEQRFGVAQKERLKELFPAVDVLTLSATPIPRTLNMAMSGLRDMSVIEEAPGDRHPVQTYVLEYDTGIILDALRRELRRGGQAYYLHNRTESIDRVAARLSAQLPDARIGIAHGRMSEEELSGVWKRLIDHEIDILVCTTIIETGVDVPNVNTLVIENCDHMGLSQLHQLRGRVGRSTRRAYAYLTFRRGKVLSEVSMKRLEAIREFTEFGSGFKIAMRDLEIRGAGSILGGEQHGHLEAVGYDLYLKLLADAVNEEKGKAPAPDFECTVDLQIEAHIPEKYISSLNQRLGVYRRIADIRREEDAMDVIDELLDRFGEPPAAVRGLIDAALLRNRAAARFIAEVVQKEESLLIYPAKLDMEMAGVLAGVLRGRVMVCATGRPYIAVRRTKGQTALDTLKEVLDILDEKIPME